MVSAIVHRRVGFSTGCVVAALVDGKNVRDHSKGVKSKMTERK